MADIVFTHRKKVWAVGGGKGGVGKSFITSNLAISLAMMGKRVIVVDLDLGGANLHTCLGSDIPQLTLTDFFAGRVSSLTSLTNKTQMENLQFISGANDSVAAANISDQDHKKLMLALWTLPSEYIFLDLGAGTHSNTLDYFLLADRPVVTVTPEPTSIENGYRFIKAAYYQWLQSVEAKLGLAPLADQAMDHKNTLGIRTPHDLVKRLIEMNPSTAPELKKELSHFKVHLIMNQVRTRNDIDMGYAIQSVCKKYFGIEVLYVGYLDHDNAVWQSVRKRRPLILEYPHSVVVQEFARIARTLDEDEVDPRAKLLRTS